MTHPHHEPPYRGLGWLYRTDRRAWQVLSQPATPAPDPSAGAALPPPIPVPTRALAARGMRFTSTSTHLTAVTALSVQAWATLQRQGWVSPLADQVALEFRHEYDWMRWRMHSRIPGYTGGYPMWFWVNRAGLQGSFGEANQVHVTARIPRGQVLVSDFEGWHAVLNSRVLHPAICPVCTDPHCEDTIHYDPDLAYDQFAARLRPHKPGQAPAASWQRLPASEIRDITDHWDGIFTPAPRTRDSALQGCAEVLRADWVTAAVLQTAEDPELLGLRSTHRAQPVTTA